MYPHRPLSSNLSTRAKCILCISNRLKTLETSSQLSNHIKSQVLEITDACFNLLHICACIVYKVGHNMQLIEDMLKTRTGGGGGGGGEGDGEDGDYHNLASGVNFDCLSHLGCSGKNANISSRQGLVEG